MLSNITQGSCVVLRNIEKRIRHPKVADCLERTFQTSPLSHFSDHHLPTWRWQDAKSSVPPSHLNRSSYLKLTGRVPRSLAHSVNAQIQCRVVTSTREKPTLAHTSAAQHFKSAYARPKLHWLKLFSKSRHQTDLKKKKSLCNLLLLSSARWAALKASQRKKKKKAGSKSEQISQQQGNQAFAASPGRPAHQHTRGSEN